MKKLALVFLSLAFTLSASAFADEQETKKDSFSMGESSLASFDMAYAEATKPCPREGEIGMSLEGLILSCQSGVWTTGGSGTNGWIFTVGGIPFYGVGSVSSGLFSGNMKCRWDTCGGFGYANCGSDPRCAASNGVVYTHYNFRGYTIGANSMPVSGASKIW